MTVISGQEGRGRFECDFLPTSERHSKEGRNFVGGGFNAQSTMMVIS